MLCPGVREGQASAILRNVPAPCCSDAKLFGLAKLIYRNRALRLVPPSAGHQSASCIHHEIEDLKHGDVGEPGVLERLALGFLPGSRDPSQGESQCLDSPQAASFSCMTEMSSRRRICARVLGCKRLLCKKALMHDLAKMLRSRPKPSWNLMKPI